MCLLHKTTVVEPGYLDIGVRVETHKEAIGEQWFLYYQVHLWAGFDTNMVATAEKVYLEGTIKGLEQTIKLELSDIAIEEVSEKWHEAGILLTTEMKDAYKYNFYAEAAKSLG